MVKYLDLKKINDSFEPELSEAVARWYVPDGICSGKRWRLSSSGLPVIAGSGIAWGRGTDWMPLRLSLWLMSVWGG